MKYLRTYEGLEYKNGDRVILNMEVLLNYYHSHTYASTFIKNLDSNDDYIQTIRVDHIGDMHPYSFSHYNWTNHEFYIKPTEIFGLATPANIEKYEKLRAMKKFNL